MTTLICQSCSFIGKESEFNPAKNITSRHEIGDTYSDLECPGCGALAYPLPDSEHAIILRAIIKELIAALECALSAWKCGHGITGHAGELAQKKLDKVKKAGGTWL